jgi:site-specific recombinase XerD
VGQAWRPTTQEGEEVMKKVRGVFEKVSSSGIWWICYFDANRRKRREKVGRKGDAIDLYRKRKTEAHQGKKLPEKLRAKAIIFSVLAQDAIQYSKGNKMSYRQDVYRMSKLLSWIGNRVADSITPQEIEYWLTEQADKNKWKPATVNRFKALLSLTFRLGMQNGKAAANPARLVRRRREDNARIRFLSRDEGKLLRFAIEAKFPQHIVEFDVALNTGMRRKEQYSLTWECVDFERKLITVAQSKNGEMRHVPMNKTVADALQNLYATSSRRGRIFLSSRSGDPLLGPRHWFEPVVVDAKLQNFTWHCLRHTFASRLVMAGVDLRTVQQLMGHKTLQMTVRYAHLAPEHQLAAVERLCDTPASQGDATDTTSDTGPLQSTDSAIVALN